MQINERQIARNQEWRVVKITEVNPATNHFAAQDQYGTPMLLTLMGGIVQEIPAVGEQWAVSRKGSDWRLENRLEQPDTQLPIASMNPGDVRIEASGAISLYGSALKFNGASVGGSSVASVFGRTGTIVATTGDYTVAQVTGAAPLASPTFTGTPAAPTPSTADNSTKIATTAFVKAQGYLTSNAVTSVFTRTGAVVATTGDYTVAQVTGAAPLASPTFTGTPAAPTATAGTNTTQLATTAFVQTAISGIGSAVTSVFGRTGAVTANTGDYTAAKVTNAGDKASSSAQIFTGALTTGPTASGVFTTNGVYIQEGSSTGGGIWSIGANVAFTVLQSAKNGEANPRFSMTVDGGQAWGPGSTGLDSNLYRNGAGALKTDGTFTAGGRFYSGAAGTGGMWVDGGTQQFIGSNTANVVGIFNNGSGLGWVFGVDNLGITRATGGFQVNGIQTSGGIGYDTGAGGTASVAGTSLTLNKLSGQVTFTGQSNSASVPKAFSVTNSGVEADDVVVVSINSSTTAGGSFVVSASAAAGIFTIVAFSTTANSSVTYSFNFAIIKVASS